MHEFDSATLVVLAMAEVVESGKVDIVLSSYSEHESDTDVITLGKKRSRSRPSNSENK